jgi:hypothetical protein
MKIYANLKEETKNTQKKKKRRESKTWPGTMQRHLLRQKGESESTYDTCLPFAVAFMSHFHIFGHPFVSYSARKKSLISFFTVMVIKEARKKRS